MVATNPKKQKIEDYIWLIFSQVKGLDDDSKQLLKAMALLPVATPFDLDFLKGHFAFFNITDAVAHLDALIERGWLQKEQAEGQKPYFKMHPLIGDVVVEHLGVDVEFADNYIDYVTSLIFYHNTNPEHSLIKKKQYIPLAKRLDVVFLGENTERIFFLVYWLAILNKHIGFFSEGIFFCERALEIAENLPQKDYYQISCCLNVLGMCHLDVKDYNKAASLVEKSISIALKKYNEYDITLSFNYSNLAMVYKESKRYDSAIIYLEKALAIDKKEYGNDHPKIAIDLGILGEVKTCLEQYDEAAKLLEQALAIEISFFGELHTSVALRQNNLAAVYDKLGRKKQSLSLLQKAYETWSTILGEDHPDTQIAKKNLTQIQDENPKPQSLVISKLWNGLFGK